MLQTTKDESTHSLPSTRPEKAAGTRDPKSLGDLPVGKPSDFVFASGRTLSQGGRTFELPRKPEHLVQAGRYAVVSYADGEIVAVDLKNRRTDVLTEHGQLPVAGFNGQIAWITPDDKSAVVHDLTTWNSDDERTQAFPVKPQCCDDPFQVYGITAFNQLIAGTPSEGTFVWDTTGTQEPRRIRGIRSQFVEAVTPQEVVVSPDGVQMQIGQVDGGTFVSNERIGEFAQDYAGVTKYIGFTETGSALHLFDRVWTYSASGRGPAGPHPEHDLVLDLPPAIALAESGVHWEQDLSGKLTDVVLDIASASGRIPTYQVRCDVTSGACELAGAAVSSAKGPKVQLIAGPGVTRDDLDLVSRFAAVARAADSDGVDLAYLPIGVSLSVGLGDVVNGETSTDLADPAGWSVSTVGGYAGRTGDFSTLDELRGYLAASRNPTLADRPLNVFAGDPPGCAGAQPTPMSGMEGLRRITIQPDAVDSCLQWFSIDLYLDKGGTLAGVSLELREP